MTGDRPYFTDLQLTDDGDLAVDRAGRLQPVTGAWNVAHATILRLRTAVNVLPLHPDYGSRLMEQLGRKTVDPVFVASMVARELRTAVTMDRRLAAARNIQITERPEDPRDMRVDVELQLTTGELIAVQDLTAARLDELDVEIPDTDASDELFEQYTAAADLDELADILPAFEGEPSETDT